MKVGAVMPHFRQWECLQEAVDSVRGQVAALAIVDDGSCPSAVTAAVRIKEAAPWAICVALAENGGTGEAINRGVELLPSDCEWLTWVSADNIMRPDWTAKLLAAADDKTGAVYGSYCRFSPSNKARPEVRKPHHPDRLVSDPLSSYYGPAFLIRREVWMKAGPHRPGIAHDYDHWLRVEEACWDMGLEICHVDEILCDYRVHPNRVTTRHRKEFRRPDFQAHKWQKEALERRKNR